MASFTAYADLRLFLHWKIGFIAEQIVLCLALPQTNNLWLRRGELMGVRHFSLPIRFFKG